METLATILTSKDFLSSIPSVILLVVAIVILAKIMHVKVHTSHFTIGGEPAESWTERKIIQEQCDFTHTYLMGLINKIEAVCPNKKLQYDGWFTRCILEDIYDEVVHWITFNHISSDEAYVTTKQKKVCSMLYCYNVLPEFKTPEFQERVNRWVAEVIAELVRIRIVYTKQCKEIK